MPAPGLPAVHAIECTVVVPTYRGAHRLPALLDALERQIVDFPWEVVVVLDGLADDSEQVLAAHAPRLPLRVVQQELQGGAAAAMNAGIAAAHGRIIVRCDDDLLPEPEFLARHAAHHRGASVGVIGPTRDVFDGGRYASVYGRPANDRAVSAVLALPAGERWLAWAANNSAPRSVLLAVGGFDERFTYGEDFELGYRLHRFGLPMVIDPALAVLHRGPATDVQTRAARAFVSGVSRGAFDDSHPGVLPAAQRLARPRDRLWNSAVAVTAAVVRSRDGYARAGRIVDRMLDVLPRAMAGRIVALLVEAGGRAGRASGLTDSRVFRMQKDFDVAREQAVSVAD